MTYLFCLHYWLFMLTCGVGWQGFKQSVWMIHPYLTPIIKSHISLPGCDFAPCCVEVDIPKITFQSQTLQQRGFSLGAGKNTRFWWNANREYIFFCQTASIVWIPNFSVYSKQMQNYCLPKANTIQFLIQSETLQRGQWTMATKFAKIQVVSLRFIWKSHQGIFRTQISSTSEEKKKFAVLWCRGRRWVVDGSVTKTPTSSHLNFADSGSAWPA